MEDHLYILWTSANEVTFETMVAMYAGNSILRGWWREVTVIVWGDTVRLASESVRVQEEFGRLMQGGVAVSACRACAERLGCADRLRGIGIEVEYWGEKLTAVLQGHGRLLTV